MYDQCIFVLVNSSSDDEPCCAQTTRVRGVGRVYNENKEGWGVLDKST